MAGVIATIPKFQFSANGVPMVGGTLTAYIAGTTTPTTTWQDSALTIANTNPISLDARGECVLWLDPAVVYKFVLKNAQGVIQWTQDNISGSDAYLRGYLAASSGASLVGNKPAGGISAATVQAAINELDSEKASNADLAVATRGIAAVPASSRPAFIEQHISGFFGRGMLTAETINVPTEQAITFNAAAGSTTIAVASTSNLVVGGCVTIKHDNGKYGTYFIDAISANLSIRPALRYTCTVGTARIERTWYNRAHPGKFYMRELAQRIANSTEFDAAMPNGGRVLFTNVSSNPNTTEDTLTAIGGAAVSYFAASNLGDSATTATPVRFTFGRSALIDTITAAGGGCETALFDVADVGAAVVKMVYMSGLNINDYAIYVFDELGNERGKLQLLRGASSRVLQVKTLAADLRGAKQIKIRVACETYVGASDNFVVAQLDVFSAPQTTKAIIAKPAAKVVCLGDSWTAGDIRSTAEREPITTQLALELPDATIINAGVGGNTIVDMVARFDTDVTPHAPDYVVVDTGTNESYNPLSGTFDPNGINVFLQYFHTLLDKIAQIGARPIIIGVPALAQTDADTALAEWTLNDRAKAYARYFFERQARKPIVHSGTGSNGDWIKFDNGTLICRLSLGVTTTAANTLAYTAWTFPVPFAAAPKVTATLATYSSAQLISVGFVSASTTGGSAAMLSGTGATTQTVDLIAVGRWF